MAIPARRRSSRNRRGVGLSLGFPGIGFVLCARLFAGLSRARAPGDLRMVFGRTRGGPSPLGLDSTLGHHVGISICRHSGCLVAIRLHQETLEWVRRRLHPADSLDPIGDDRALGHSADRATGARLALLRQGRGRRCRRAGAIDDRQYATDIRTTPDLPSGGITSIYVGVLGGASTSSLDRLGRPRSKNLGELHDPRHRAPIDRGGGRGTVDHGRCGAIEPRLPEGSRLSGLRLCMGKRRWVGQSSGRRVHAADRLPLRCPCARANVSPAPSLALCAVSGAALLAAPWLVSIQVLLWGWQYAAAPFVTLAGIFCGAWATRSHGAFSRSERHAAIFAWAAGTALIVVPPAAEGVMPAYFSPPVFMGWLAAFAITGAARVWLRRTS